MSAFELIVQGSRHTTVEFAAGHPGGRCASRCQSKPPSRVESSLLVLVVAVKRAPASDYLRGTFPRLAYEYCAQNDWSSLRYLG